MNIYIKELPISDYVVYRSHVKSCGNLFNSLEWLDNFNGVKTYGIYDKHDLVIGGFSCACKEFLNFRILLNPPFSPFIGPFFISQSQSNSKKINESKRVMTALAGYLQSPKNILVYLAFSPEIVDFQPFQWEKFHVSPNYTYILDLGKSESELFENMSVERRNDIRKAINDGLKCEGTNDYSIVKKLILKTYTRNKKKISVQCIDKILFQYAKSDNSYSFVTYQGGEPLAGCFCIFDAHTSYYLMSGYDALHKHHGAGALALWNAIRHAKDKGIKYFDFEGSMIQPIEKYFRGFGGELKPYFRISKANFLLEVILKIKHRIYF
jgi:hypothetical protein